MLLALPALLGSLAVAGVVPDPLITAAPRLAKREDLSSLASVASSDEFIGYFTSDGYEGYNALTCPGISETYGELTTSGNIFGGCWSEDWVSFATSCYIDTVYGVYFSTSADYTTSFFSSAICDYTCISDYIVSTPGVGSTSLFFECATEDRDSYTLIRDYYSDLPALAAATTTLDSVTSDTVTSTPTTTPTPTPSTPAPSPPSTVHPPKKTPIAAIVGGVVGGLVFFAVAGILAFFLLWKKRRNNTAGPSTSHAQPVVVNGGGDGGAGAVGAGAVGAAAAGGYYSSPPEKLATVTTTPAPIGYASPPPVYAAPHGEWVNANVQPHYGVAPPPPPPQDVIHEMGGQSQQLQQVGGSFGAQQQQQPVEMAQPPPKHTTP